VAAEWGPDGFTIVALNPGWVKTDMGGPNAEISADEAAAQILDFIDRVSVSNDVNGAFVNTDGSPLPW
jgi:NAD(P)-dependent dehydrogenase (short-subunit alcohol dehydrogenase family)